MSKQISTLGESHTRIGPDWQQGYGFQFWLCRQNAYRADGAGGQLLIVMPDRDAVIAITAAGDNMQAELDAVWDNLLPAFRAASLPEHPGAQETLKQLTQSLVAHPKPAVHYCSMSRHTEKPSNSDGLRLPPASAPSRYSSSSES